MAASIRRRGPLSLEVVPDDPESHSEQVTPQRVSFPHHALTRRAVATTGKFCCGRLHLHESEEVIRGWTMGR